jgi:hypothetical protein
MEGMTRWGRDGRQEATREYTEQEVGFVIDNSGTGYFWREILVDKKIEHLSFVSHGPAFLGLWSGTLNPGTDPGLVGENPDNKQTFEGSREYPSPSSSDIKTLFMSRVTNRLIFLGGWGEHRTGSKF